METTVWLISLDRPEKKESGSVDGCRRKNHYAAHFMEKTREKEEWMGAGVATRLISWNRPESNVEGCRRSYAAHVMERPESSGEGCRRIETTVRLISWKRPERKESVGVQA